MPDAALPERGVIDAHVHLWDPDAVRMTWIDKNPLLNRRYSVPEFREAAPPERVEGFVYVETGAVPHFTLLEVKWAAARAAEEPRLKAIVAAAPIEHGRCVAPYLKELVALSPLVKGIRRITQGEGDPAFCLKPDFVAGAQLLPDFGLTFDLCINHLQLEPTTALVAQCPKTRFILDHCGKPNVKGHLLDPWRENIRKLAALPNVVCKLSGLVTEADRALWTPEDLAPYVKHLLETFGPERLCFGSDWPVCLQASTHQRWMETLAALLAHLPAAQRARIWGANTQAFYAF